MKSRTILAVAAVLAQATSGAVATAEGPVCPAWRGGYVATVTGGAFSICPPTTPPPGEQANTCPHTTGMMRVDERTGGAKMFLGPCVPDPAGDGSGDAGTPCYLDPCVPNGTYEYGYQIPKFIGCNDSCAGPTSGELATVVTVSSSACEEDGGGIVNPPGLSLALWRDLDAGAVDGAVTWSGTCTGPLPGPDGGYCAWEFLDGAAQWAPCPPDGGTLCPGYTADGDAVPVECPPPGTGGSFSGNAANSGSDAGGTAVPGETPAAAAAGGGDGEGGGCAVSRGEEGGNDAYAALATLALAIGIRGKRHRRRAR